jgi:hypothetical protein
VLEAFADEQAVFVVGVRPATVKKKIQQTTNHLSDWLRK